MQIDPNTITWDDAPAPQPRGPVYGPDRKPPAPRDPLAIRKDEIDIAKGERDLANPASGPETYSMVSPEEARQMGLNPGKVYQRSSSGGLKEVGDAAGGAGGDAAARLKLAQTIAKLGALARDANDNGGWFETGTSGRIGRNIPLFQTAGKDLSANLDTLRANFAFDALQAMRDASKTGGALGSVSEMELQLLQSAVANIDPNQSQEQFLANIESARQAYLAKLAMVDPQLATRMGYDSKKAEAALLSLNDAYNKEFGIADAAPTIDRSAAPGAMQNPQDIDAILAKYGVQ